MLKYIRKSELYLNSFKIMLAESLQKEKNKKRPYLPLNIYLMILKTIPQKTI
jgi:hypothetical protein